MSETQTASMQLVPEGRPVVQRRRSPHSQRRTQKQRSAATRALLLDVTIECLAERGYQGTTAQVIAKRAGLSRGAQLHHFGSKMQLVIQAMERLFERRLADYRDGFAKIPVGEMRTAAALDLLWQMVSGPAGHAYLELVIASRTDPELQKSMVALTKRVDAQVEEAFEELFTVPDSGLFDLVWTTLFALMEGLAIEKMVRPDDDKLDQVLVMLKQLAPMVMAARSL